MNAWKRQLLALPAMEYCQSCHCALLRWHDDAGYCVECGVDASIRQAQERYARAFEIPPVVLGLIRALQALRASK